MDKRNSVFIATSLDGYIADRHDKIDWLLSIPNPEQQDMGYQDFIADIDAILMGRNTFEVVCGFGGEWPYPKPVFVLSNSMESIPPAYQGKVNLLKGEIQDVLKTVHDQGYLRLYIDGGVVIQQFLKEDLIDDMIITTIPYLLGGGTSLFGSLDKLLKFKCVEAKVEIGYIAQAKYSRDRS